MKKTEEIDGWFNYNKTFDFLINSIPHGGKFAECGAWLGKSSSYLCDAIAQHRPDITPYIIDSWQASEDETEMLKLVASSDVYQTFLENMGDRKFTPIKNLSIDAAKQFDNDSLDVIFIDMCHTYDCVKEDIESWYPKLKLNGYMAGHDFSNSGVNQAVYEKFPARVSPTHGDCWLVKKTGDNYNE
jgi:hypothetical protein